MNKLPIGLTMIWLCCADVAADVQESAGRVVAPETRYMETANSGGARLPAIAHPRLSSTLRFLVPGTIATVHVVEGQRVQKGDPLVTLDDRLARARLRVAEISANRRGELDYAAIQLKYGEMQLARLEHLFQQNAVAEREVEEQHALVERARAVHTTRLEELDLAKSNRQLAEEQLRHLTLFAPFDGVITEIHEKLGVPVDPATAVVSMANLEQLQVELHTPVRLYGSLRPGDSIGLMARAPVDAEIVARVVTTSPVINAASGTFRCVLAIDNSAHKFPAGFAVTLSP